MRAIRSLFAAAGIAAAGIGGLLVTAPQAQASFIITVSQSGADVLVSGSGSINLAGLTPAGGAPIGGAFYAGGTLLAIGFGDGTPQPLYGGISGPSSFGSGSFAIASSHTGLMFALDAQNDQLILPTGYVSGTSYSASATFANTTIAALGIDTGTYTWSWGSGGTADSVQMNVTAAGPTEAPEPASLLLFGMPAAWAALARRRRSRPALA